MTESVSDDCPRQVRVKSQDMTIQMYSVQGKNVLSPREPGEKNMPVHICFVGVSINHYFVALVYIL